MKVNITKDEIWRKCRYCGLPAFVSIADDIDRIACNWCGGCEYYCNEKLISDNIVEMHTQQFKQNNRVSTEFKGEKYIVKVTGVIKIIPVIDLKICEKCKIPPECALTDLVEIVQKKLHEMDDFRQVVNYVCLPTNCPFYLEQLMAVKHE